MELDHIWGAWETGAELANDQIEWLKQPALRRDNLRYHVTVHASHREQRWETHSVSLIERDPVVIPDVDIAAKVGTDLILDEKIPRHESGRGYVRVVEHLVLWKEKEASKVFTYQGLTTCAEVDKSWTIMGSVYNHVRTRRGVDERSMALFLRREVEHQDRLEAAGYWSPTWRVLRALQSLISATQLKGESAVAAPPFFPNAGRVGLRTCSSDTKRLGCVEPSATNEGRSHTKRV